MLTPGSVSPVSLHDDWLVAEADCSLALADWWQAHTASAKSRAYASYVAALEREELAADLLAARLGHR
jgi:hypothetical protein